MRPPARSPEARENQLIAAAMDLAEEQIRNGTATSQVISHFLKLGSTRESLEKAMLKEQVALARAKTENMKSAVRIEELYGKAISAMRMYQGQSTQMGDDEEL